jgi:hypothetical protein
MFPCVIGVWLLMQANTLCQYLYYRDLIQFFILLNKSTTNRQLSLFLCMMISVPFVQHLLNLTTTELINLNLD